MAGWKLNWSADNPIRKRIGITRLEEDAGKLVHAGSDRLSGSSYSLVDFNRTGVPTGGNCL